jgi:PhoPQ-activated pathogenicity-related protein
MIKIILSSLIVIYCCNFKLVSSNALDDYVNSFDPYTNYTLIETYQLNGATGYVLNFTSQKWFDETVSNRPIWWHYLCIAVPDALTRPDTGYLLIDGGSNHPEYN